MKLNAFKRDACPNRLASKILLVMKITTFFLILGIMSVSARTVAQKITLNEKHAQLADVLAKISQQSGFDVVYDAQLLKKTDVTINVTDVNIEEALSKSLEGLNLSYKLTEKTIVIKPKEESFIDKIKAYIAAIDVQGRVINEDLQPLSGATVSVKNTNIATTTDANGWFSLKQVQPDAILIVSYIGYDKREIAANSNLSAIRLNPSTNPLDEVKVIAYGRETQRLSVGNVTTITSKDISKQPVGDPLLALEGMVPGLFITQNSGVPGSGVNIRIQGLNSIQSGTIPFFVIDGVPYESRGLSTTFGGIGGSSNATLLSFINPDDIESISVLKDADATAIYGSQAANGAILITTKKGKVGTSKVDFNIQQGWGNQPRTTNLLNTTQYLQMRREAFKNDGATPGFYDDDVNGTWDTTRYTNWQKVLMGRTAQYADYNMDISGGSENVQYLVGGTFHRETTVFPGDFSDQKGSLHFSLNTSSTNKKFKMQFTGSYLFDNNLLPASDLTSLALTLAPDAPPLYNPNGTLNWQLDSNGSSTWLNPLSYLYNPTQTKTYNLISSGQLSYMVLPGFEIRTNLGYNNMQIGGISKSLLAATPTDVIAQIGPSLSRYSSYFNNSTNSWLIEPQVTYSKNFGSHKINFLAGATIRQNEANGTALYGQGYNSDNLLDDIHAASTISASPSAQSTYKYSALYGRLNYNVTDKYLLNLSVRRDGSSRFGPANEFHNFWSVGAGWNFSEEKFFKDHLGFLSFGKLRGSYGSTGNDQIGDYQFLNLYSSTTAVTPYQGATGLAPNGLPNPYLEWEETRKLQGGIDVGLFNDRILLTTNYVYNRSSNELLALSLPYTTGFAFVTVNLPAVVQNTEWEFSLSTQNVKTDQFKWSTNFNLTIPENKLVSYSGTLPGYLIIGQPIGVRQMFHFLGVDPATGQYQFADSNGNPTFNPNPGTDRTVLKSPFPSLYGGFQNSFSFKNFSLSIFFQFTKQEIANNRFGPSLPGSAYVNEPITVLSRWREPGDVTDIQRFNQDFSLTNSYNNAMQSDAAYSNIIYARLKNVSLSYQIPPQVIQKVKIQNARIFVNGQNLLTIAPFKGLDPETAFGLLPPIKVITLGLNVSF